MSAIVTDASKRVGLSIVRSLGRGGVNVTAADTRHVATAFFSKYCKHRVTYAPPELSSDNFIASMLALVKKRRYDVLIPYSDLVMISISRSLSKFLPYVRVPIADHSTIAKAHDKAEVLKIAEQHNIPCPKTYTIREIGELDGISKNVQYPVVIKPRASTIWHGEIGATISVSSENFADSPEQLVDNYRKVHGRSRLPLIQEYVPGDGYGVSALLNDSDPRAVFVHKRLREYPVTGGASTLRVSISYPELRDLGLRMLKALNWHGVAMVEFKLDTRDNTPKLMEVNGRFWGSLALAICSGVDFPYLLYKMAADGDTERVFDYKIGVKCRWLIPGDMLSLLDALKRSRDRWKTVLEFLRFYEPDLHYDEFSTDDPWPVIGATIVGLQDFCDTLRGKRSVLGEYVQKQDENRKYAYHNRAT
jgi:predicted ATP-grasp superfamily ATP-dependent carboligase